MAMNGNILGDKIAALITDPNAPPESVTKIKKMWESISSEIVNHIIQNIEIQISIPSASVIISVSGGSAAPAVGVPNPSEIVCLQKSVS